MPEKPLYCRNCVYKQKPQDEEPCKSGHAAGNLDCFQENNSGPARERMIGHEAIANESQQAAPKTVCESTSINNLTNQDAIRMLKEAEREAKAQGKKDRQKAIRGYLNVLGNESPKKIVSIPENSLTCPIDILERFTSELNRSQGIKR